MVGVITALRSPSKPLRYFVLLAAIAVLTSTYLAVFGSWLFDDSPDAQRSQALLARLLAAAAQGARALAYPG